MSTTSSGLSALGIFGRSMISTRTPGFASSNALINRRSKLFASTSPKFHPAYVMTISSVLSMSSSHADKNTSVCNNTTNKIIFFI